MADAPVAVWIYAGVAVKQLTIRTHLYIPSVFRITGANTLKERVILDAGSSVMPSVISLFDLTGTLAKPWLASHHVYQFDMQLELSQNERILMIKTLDKSYGTPV